MNSLQQTDIDLKELIGILQCQIRQIAMSFVLVLLPAIAYLMLATPIYNASTLITIDAGGSNIMDPTTSENTQSQVLNSRVDGEVEILRADSTVMAVVREANLIQDPEFGPKLGLNQKIAVALGLDQIAITVRRMLGIQLLTAPQSDELVANAVTQLKDAVDIRRRGLTYLISVGVAAEDPVRAAEIANSYVKTYIAQQVVTKSQGIMSARDVLRRQTEAASTGLAQSEDALNNFIDQNLAKLEQESGNAAISALRKELETAKSNKVDSVAILALTRDAAVRSDWTAAAQSLGDAVLQELAAQRENLAKRLSGESSGSAEQLDLKQALGKLDQDLANQLKTAQGAIESKLSTITNAETLARQQLRDSLLQSDLSSSAVADLFNLQQSASIARTQYQQLLARVQDLNALANVQISDARVVSEALPPINPSSPNKTLIVALATIVGIALGIVVALLNEYYIGGVTSAEQLSNVIGARVPVAVPILAMGMTDRLLADEIITTPLSQYSESFRKLRLAIDTSLQRNAMNRTGSRADPHKGKVILVCSALPGEGKTTTAISVARTYAAAGVNTLLIDCDLRKPSVAEYLDFDASNGLINYLIDAESNPEMIIHPMRDQLSGATVIVAGHRSNRPTDQLINSARFASVIEVVRDMYDIIVIDSPPLLPVVDTRYLAQSADCAVMVVRFSSTTQSEARDAASQIQEALLPEVTLLGVLNRQVKQTGKGGYYSRGYSGYYGE
jgi:succinoglycan biosynthesis transport protein ExoP